MSIVSKRSFRTADPIELANHLESVMVCDAITTSPSGTPCSIECHTVSPHLTILECEISNTIASWKLKDKVLITLCFGRSPFHMSGYFMDCETTPLLSCSYFPEHQYYSSFPETTCTLIMLVDQEFFALEMAKHSSLKANSEKHAAHYFQSKTVKTEFIDKLRGLIHQDAPELQESAGQEVASQIINDYFSSIEPNPTPIMMTRAQNTASAAFDYLMQNPKSNIRLDALCSVIGAPSRTIQQGFKDIFAMGPIEYHRYYRLNKVRELIKNETSSDSTILELASEYGFEHAGRFSAHYKDLFGISPSLDRNTLPYS